MEDSDTKGSSRRLIPHGEVHGKGTERPGVHSTGSGVSILPIMGYSAVKEVSTPRDQPRFLILALH